MTKNYNRKSMILFFLLTSILLMSTISAYAGSHHSKSNNQKQQVIVMNSLQTSNFEMVDFRPSSTAGIITNYGGTSFSLPNAQPRVTTQSSLSYSQVNNIEPVSQSKVDSISALPNVVTCSPLVRNDAYSVVSGSVLSVAAPGVFANDYDISCALAPGHTNPSHGSLSFTGSTGAFTYTPNAGYVGSDSWTYTVAWEDAQGALNFDTGTVSITVTSPNSPPNAYNDAYTTNEDTAKTGNVLTNDNDPNGDSLTASMRSNPSHGSVSLSSNGAFTYTPSANYHGTDTFTYYASDGKATDWATVTITINSVNDAPAPKNDAFTGSEDNVITGNVLANDADVDGDALSAIIRTNPSHGGVSLSANGFFTYTPAANYYGADSFTYYATDGKISVPATVSINITPVNDAPVATADSYLVNEDTQLSADVSINDYDIDSNTLTFSVVTDAAHGILLLHGDGTFVYTPVPNYNGPDSFTYRISDGSKTDTAVVTISVKAVNDSPVAVNDAVSGNEDSSISGDVSTNDSDVDGDTLTFIINTIPSHGQITIYAAGTFTYVPDANYNGVDSFTYRVTDGSLSAVGTVTITILPVNDAPTAVNDSFSTNEDTAVSGNVATNDSDIDGDSLSYSVNTGASSGSVVLNADGTFTYTPALNFNGIDSFTYTVSDGALSAVGTVTITVSPVNDAPTATDDSFSTNEDIALSADVSTNDNDVDGDTLSYSVTTGVTNGSLVLNTDGTFTYTPDLNFNGVDSFTYTVSDGLLSATATVTLTVTAVNDAPTAVDDSFTTDEDNAVSGDVSLNDSDVENDILSYSVNTDVSSGSLTFNTDGTFTYTPDLNFNGVDSFTYTVSDGALTAVGTVTITVNAVNDAPVGGDDSFTTNEDTAVSGDLSANDTDVDGDTLTIILNTSPSHGLVSIYVAGPFTYTPFANFHGTDSFTYKLSDGTASVIVTVTITVLPVNDAPVAVDDSFSTAEDTSLLGDVSTNDSDVDGDTLSYSVLTDVSNGALTFNADGTFSYAPNTNFNGVDSFTYTVSDGSLSATGTVTITVNAANDAPVAVNDKFITDEDTTLLGDVSLNDTDIDGDILTFTLDTGVSNGALTFNADGTFTYTPDLNFNGVDSFTYTVSDGLLSAKATVSITIVPVNDTPVAGDDSFSINEDSSLLGDVSTNDSDIDGDTLSYSVLTDVSNGVLTINADGTFDYTPDANFNGVDSFTYTVSDGSLTATGTVTITINPVNDAPTGVDDSFTTSEDTSVSGDVSLNDSDIDGDTLTYSIYTDVAYGVLTFNTDGTFTYTPGTNFHGTDSFTYAVSDGIASVLATVKISVTPVNDAPVANDDTAITNEDISVSGNVALNDSDVDKDVLTYSLATDVSNGVLTFNTDGTFTYTPNANFNGFDSFTYTVSDGSLSATGTVTITINAVNDTPVGLDDSFTTSEDTSVSGDVSLNDSDVDGDTLTYSIYTDVAYGVLTFNADGTFTYTPNANFNGPDSFTYAVSDSIASVFAAVKITVTAVNDAPVAVDDSANTNEDASVMGNVALNDSDVDKDVLTYSLATDVSNGVLTFNADGTFTYAPNADFNGLDSFTYTVSDGLLSATATVTITIAAAPDAPVAVNDSFSTNEDTAVSGDMSLNDYDVDGDALTYSLYTNSAYGDASINADGTFTFTPAADFNGETSFVYMVSDGFLSATGTVTITVAPVNDAPTAVDDNFSVNEDGSLNGDVSTNDSDIDGDSLTFTLDTDVTNGALSFKNDGTFVYIPNANFNGADSFTYTVSDGVLSATAAVTITIVPVNDAPVAGDDSFSMDEDGFLSGDVSANDSDLEGDALSFSISVDVAHGTLTWYQDGTFNYVPNADFFGSDGFAYTVSDGVATDTGVVTITINGINDPPSISNVSHSPSDLTDLDNVVVSAEVVDVDGNLASVTLYYSVNGGTWTSVAMADNAGTYEGTIPAQSYGTTVSYYIVAEDSLDESVQSSTVDYSVLDTDAPTISDVTNTPEQPGTANEITVSARVEDAGSGVATVTLYYQIDDGEWQTLSMDLYAGLYYATIAKQKKDTVVNYYIEASDNAGNVATSDQYSFTVVPGQGSGGPSGFLDFSPLAFIISMLSFVAIAKRFSKRKL